MADNPQARQAAISAARRTAYSAGVLARKIIPRGLVE
jgi:hypothetical protein